VRAVAQDDTGNIYALDSGNGRVQVFDSSGKFLTSFGQVGTETGEFSNTCNGLTLTQGAEVHVIVADTGNDRIQVFRMFGLPS
jgi:DNA-binding beta-propeller fold protein YncE